MTEEPGRAIDPERVAVAWRSRGYSCHRMVDPPGQCWRDFVHAENELLVVVEGRLELEVEGQIQELGPGEEVFIPARARHTVRNTHQAPTHWLFGYD